MKKQTKTTILAIETSCDETAVAVIKASKKNRPSFKILSNVVSSQIEIHKKWGGVYPALAKREHQKNLVLTLQKALKESKLLKISKKIPNPKSETLCSILKREQNLYQNTETFLKKYKKPAVDAIAITHGPGLEPCLWVGVNFAKALAYWWNLPIIPVNHVEAHIFANFIKKQKFSFPAVCLIVSGGHTQLILMKDFGKYKILGETRDDAAGECFDKVAKILGLGYPGGPIIAKEATKIKINEKRLSIRMPRPMINSKDYDFSFSGLKTAVLYNFQKQPKEIQKSKEYIQAMAAETQQTIIDVLIAKTLRAAKDYKVKTIILGGGVSANEELRRQFKEKITKEISTVKYLIPDTKYSTDNAAMIGVAGFFHIKEKNRNIRRIKADSNIKIC